MSFRLTLYNQNAVSYFLEKIYGVCYSEKRKHIDDCLTKTSIILKNITAYEDSLIIQVARDTGFFIAEGGVYYNNTQRVKITLSDNKENREILNNLNKQYKPENLVPWTKRKGCVFLGRKGKKYVSKPALDWRLTGRNARNYLRTIYNTGMLIHHPYKLAQVWFALASIKIRRKWIESLVYKDWK